VKTTLFPYAVGDARARVASFPLREPERFKAQALSWAARFDPCCHLDSNGRMEAPYAHRGALVAVGAVRRLHLSGPKGAFEALRSFHRPGSWAFGALSYELKDDLENLHSHHPDPHGFPALFFFEPEIVLELAGAEVRIHTPTADPAEVFREIQGCPSRSESGSGGRVRVRARFSREAYLERAQALLKHIHRGDIYEVNFCQEFFAEEAHIQPVEVFRRLNALNRSPFSAFFRSGPHHLLCSSPERFLRRRGERLIAQPIKGTARRSPDPRTDAALKAALQRSPKERCENIMIVDLVRNDLGRIAQPGSVQVEELCGIYSYPRVHQMVSTVTGRVEPGTSAADILRSAFPMGSMTGAPKVRAMELIEQYEATRRGLYSGSVGYLAPDGDFDFNVVIRSILWNARNGYLSFHAGSALTAAADPRAEFEECLLKAEAMMQALR